MPKENTDMKTGLFNQKQLKILRLRARGFTQLEAAKELGTTRANISMIEWRARKKLDKARETIHAYEALQSSHKVSVGKGTKLAEVPMIVLHEGDRHHIHVRSDIIEIVRLVRALKPSVVRDGKTIRDLEFKINERGKLEVS
jgi:HTH-type transcriptional regulator, fmd operon transcriptional regulator